MICKIRKWKLSDAAALAAAVSNKKILDNLRDGLPYPYTEKDGEDYISDMLSANAENRILYYQGYIFKDMPDSYLEGNKM